MDEMAVVIVGAILGGLLTIVCALVVVIVKRTGEISKDLKGKVDKDACHSIREKQQRDFDRHEHNNGDVIIKVV